MNSKAPKRAMLKAGDYLMENTTQTNLKPTDKQKHQAKGDDEPDDCENAC